MPDEFCDEMALVGPAGRIRERYRAWADSGITGLTVVDRAARGHGADGRPALTRAAGRASPRPAGPRADRPRDPRGGRCSSAGSPARASPASTMVSEVFSQRSGTTTPSPRLRCRPARDWHTRPCVTTASVPPVAAASARTASQARSTRAWKTSQRLAIGRRVVGREEVEAEVVIGGAADVAEVPLLQQRVEGERGAGGAPQPLGGAGGAREVAGDDARDAVARQPARQRLRLRLAARREGDVRTLDDTRRVTLGFPVANQEDTAHGSRQV